MQKVNYFISSTIIGTGIVVGILIGIGKVEVSALLLISPMIMFGVWIMAVDYTHRRNNAR